jgi:UDP-N-acetylmuramate dehydrogenase
MTTSLPIRFDVSLRQFNTFGVESTARAYLPVTSVETLRAVRSDPKLARMPRLVLGGGSNLLLTRDFDGLVLHMQNRGIEVVGENAETAHIRVQAGESWHGFVLWTLAHGHFGLENLSLIPGSAGAAPIQNIGAYGVEVKEFIESVRFFDADSGDIHVLSNDECRFAYRDSVFKHRLRDRAVILDVTYALPKAWKPNLRYADVEQEIAARGIASPTARDISDAVIAIRTRKLPDPARIGNAGSFFKNPVVSAEKREALLASHPQLVSYAQADGTWKLAAGWMIDQCGWKGRSIGAAGVHDRQALVLVNRGGATGREIAGLADAIRADVMRHFGVELDAEPVTI